ncbi:MAG TPA: amino acid permease [Azoarcus sp.]|nr:amino acid permease [Azoarcus sp.]
MPNACNSPAVKSPVNLSSHGLSVSDGVAVLVGVVVGMGIFGLPPLVAQASDSPATYIGLWLGGGFIMLLGALCYAELGSAWPHSGGEYHFLRRAWGPSVSLLFAWARCSVIQTGSIAVVAFIYGEYAQRVVPLGAHGEAYHAGLSVIMLTALNILGTNSSKRVQVVFSTLTVLALLVITGTGLAVSGNDVTAVVGAEVSTAASTAPAAALGMGMIFVLLAYGGWNEAAYVSGELREPARNMPRVLIIGTLLVTAVYLLVNLVYLATFGLDGLRDATAIGAEMVDIAFGPMSAVVLSLVICVAALSTLNATILTGARVYYALGRDLPLMSALSAWDERGSTPIRALVLQGLVSLILIVIGANSRNGIESMVAYTAPVFWFFMCLTALSVIVLRIREPEHARPFRVPLYPLPPLLFGAICLALLWSAVSYAGVGAWLGVAVLVAGLPLLWLDRRSPKTA